MAFTFDGFEPANTTPVPDVLFDVLLPELNEAQLKVMLYIIRRTLGFKKTSDAISLRQFRFGIITKEKKQLDSGCGLKNFTTISKALQSLEKMNCIERAKATTDAGDDDTTVYRIKFAGTTANVVPTTDDAVPSYAKRSTGTTPDGGRVLRQTEPQLNSNTRNSTQETDRQEEGEIATSNEDRNAPALIDFEEKRQKRETNPRMKAVKIGASNDTSHTLPADVSSCVSGSTSDDAAHEEASQERQQALTESSQRHATAPDGQSELDTSLSSLGTAAPAQRSALSPSAAVQGANQEKRKGKRKPGAVPDVQPVPKCDTRDIQKRINEHRGYALEEDTEIIRERKAIKTWCNLHTLEEYSFVMQGLKKDKYWGKDENYYRIGGLILLKETPGILAKLNNYPLKAAANGDVAPQEDDDYSGFDIYKGNGKEERAALRALGEQLEAEGKLIW